jgi:formyltetrahydrofolate deformylase
MSGAGVASATLLVSCRDRTGLVAALSEFVFVNGGNIRDADQHAEAESGLFFMRLVWDLAHFKLSRQELAAAMSELAARFELTWDIHFSDQVPRVAVFASRSPHCLYDLLLCHGLGELGGSIVQVVSNHPEISEVAEHFHIPFTCIPVTTDSRAAAEARARELLESLQVDLVVLARYMQILSPQFVQRYPRGIINIHHSFLPAFVGAKPYHQAKERGVKIIGATAHYVTEHLDQGPIIEQDVCRVSHRDEVDDLVRKGRELERQVLTRAVRLHLQRRVLLSGNRTIVFG